MLDYTVRKAQSLGLFVDMSTGTGWCFGGPGLPPDAIDAKARYDAKANTVTLAPGAPAALSESMTWRRIGSNWLLPG